MKKYVVLWTLIVGIAAFAGCGVKNKEVVQNTERCLVLSRSNWGSYSQEEKRLWTGSTTTIYRNGTLKSVIKYTDGEEISSGTISEKEMKAIDKLLGNSEFLEFVPEESSCDGTGYHIYYEYGDGEHYEISNGNLSDDKFAEYYNELERILK